MQPVTIANLKASRQLLEMGCLKCGHTAYASPHFMPFADEQPVPGIARRLRCSRCNAPGEYCHARPDARIDQNLPFQKWQKQWV